MKWIGFLAVATMLAGCGGTTSVVAQGDEGKPAVGNGRPTGTWRTTSVDQTPSASVAGSKPESFGMQFFDDGRVSVSARCNSLGGTYRIEGGRFRMDEIMQTEMGCPGENRHEEDQWLGAFLAAGPKYAFDGQRISLDTDSIRVALKQNAKNAADEAFVGTRWKVDSALMASPSGDAGSTSASPPFSPAELVFTDTAVNGKVGCATLAGPAKRDGDKIRFGQVVADQSKCLDGEPAVGELLSVLKGDVALTFRHLSMTLMHPSGKGLSLRAVQDDAPAAGPGPKPVVDEPQTGATEPAVAPPLDGEWRTNSIRRTAATRDPLVPPAAFTLRFLDDGQVSAQARCQTFSGPYKVVDGHFVMDPTVQTKEGCSGDRHDEDQWMIGFLLAKPSFDKDGKAIVMATGTHTVKLQRAE